MRISLHRYILLFCFLLIIQVLSLKAQECSIPFEVEKTEYTDTLEVEARELQKINSIVVTGVRYGETTRNMPFTVSTISGGKLSANRGLNMLPVLSQQVPGLFVTSRGIMGYGVSAGSAGAINIRGLSSASGQVLVLINGNPQYQGIYGHSIADTYLSNSIERVEVIRSPASVLYGSNAMGGVVNIITKDSNIQGLKSSVSVGAGSYSTAVMSAKSQYGSKKINATMALEYGRSHNHRANMSFGQIGCHGGVTYYISDVWNLFGSLSLDMFDSEDPGTEDSPLLDASQSVRRSYALFGVENKGDIFNGKAVFYGNFGRNRVNDGHTFSQEPQSKLFRSKDALYGIDVYENVSFTNSSKVTLGATYNHIFGDAYYKMAESGEIWVPENEVQSKSIGRRQFDEMAVYAQLNQRIASVLTLDVGLRYDYHSHCGGEVVPQIGAVCRVMENADIKFLVSKGFRNPTMKEMYLYPPSNDSLRAERLWNYELGWRHTIMEGSFIYGVNIFLSKCDNIIVTDKTLRKNLNSGILENKGVEVECSWNIDKAFQIGTTHSYIHTNNSIVGTPEYMGTLYANCSWGRWSLNTCFEQVNGLCTLTESSEKESFSLLGICAGVKLSKSVHLWLKGDNLLSQKYEINGGYPMPRATFMAGIEWRF